MTADGPSRRGRTKHLALSFALLFVLAPATPAAVWPGPDGTTAVAALPDPVPCPDCWTPDVQTSWQWQLQGRIDTSVDAQMYDVDAFDVPKRLVRKLHRKGRAVVCYVSAGSWERWRPDAERFPDSVLGNELDGWPGERWLDVRRIRLLAPIMKARMHLCVRKGFDGIEFDNVDGYANDTGFEITAGQQLCYNIWLANQAHRRGLSVALKNDLDQAEHLLPYFDYALNEECFTHDECDLLTPFVEAGKAVFGVEYDLPTDQFCPQANDMDFNFLKKRPSLRAWRIACR
jgi:hypothetical protein